MNMQKLLPYYQAGFNITGYPAGSKGGNLQWGKWQSQRQTIPELVALSRKYANFGAIVGFNDLIVLDFDDMPSYCKFKAQYGEMAITTSTKTARGIHLWYRCKVLGDYTHPMAELWLRGKYASLPNNIHPSGYVYQEMLGLEHLLTLSDVTQIGALSHCKGKNVATMPTCKTLYNGIGKVATIKNAVQIFDILPLDVVLPIRSGQDYMLGFCPMHEDHTRSLSIHLGYGRVKCLAAGCALANSRGNDVISLYAKLNGISERDAIQEMYARIPAARGVL